MRNILLLFLLLLGACRQEAEKSYSVWMAESEMLRCPELWQVDFVEKPKWDYTQGLIAQAMLMTAEVSGDDRFYKYVRDFAEQFVDMDGKIKTYKKEQYSLDRVNGGKFLWRMWHLERDEKYRKAAIRLFEQLDEQPRTSEGGFWHKLVYPHQMWLDGLYMGAPFYAECASELNRIEDFNDVIDQFVIIHRHTYDVRTGLNFHGWDESRQQLWANKETGCSPHIWGRAMGWYFMALVDVLDFIPQNHPRRGEILNLLQQVAEGVKNSQDEKSGVWYQVMDQPGREGNYLEATASSMFVYAYYKSIRLGYLARKNWMEIPEKGYQGILKHFVQVEENGTLSLKKCCGVAGLGGKPYRSGSFDYYIRETVRENDPKGVAPFIMASLEREKSKCLDNNKLILDDLSVVDTNWRLLTKLCP